MADLNVKKKLSRLMGLVLEWAKPENPLEDPITHHEAVNLLERKKLSSLLNYRAFDEDNDFFFMDDGSPAIGFGFQVSPLLGIGLDSINQLEAIMQSLPDYSTIQFGLLSTPQVQGFLDQWCFSRIKSTKNPVLRQMALRRRDFYLKTSTGPSMLLADRLHPRNIFYYVFIKIPFSGEVSAENDRLEFMSRAIDIKKTVQGVLDAVKICGPAIDESLMKLILREMLNPHLDPAVRFEDIVEGAPLSYDVVDKNTKIDVKKDGLLGFSNGGDSCDVVVAPITMDVYPKNLMPGAITALLGVPESWTDRITCPFWHYTTMVVLNQDSVNDLMITKMGALNKQTMSDSQWFLSMMSHLFTRKEETTVYCDQIKSNHRPIKMLTGINLYCHPDEAKQQIEYVKGLWKKNDFKASEEKNISLPVFLASLPFQYSYAMDNNGKGLQRGLLCHSLNGGCAAPLQGDWGGTQTMYTETKDKIIFGAGPLLVSRRGQVISLDLFQSSTNYNFIVVATSGAGKSFFSNEIICDFLSKNGVVRVIDVGKSYHRLATILGGSNIVFSTENPKSINPFSGIKTETDLYEMLPMLKPLLRQMAYPLKDDTDVNEWTFQFLETAIGAAWKAKREHAGLKDIYDFCQKHPDPRAKDLADMLMPYAIGRYAKWFNGPREIHLDNQFVVLELEELNTDLDLRAVVLNMMIHQITKDMYQSDRSIPKLLLVDEAWDLFSNAKAGVFIETAFRRVRKYMGCAGVITQSFADFDKNNATKAIMSCASWKFILKQSPTSTEHAFGNKMLMGDESFRQMINSVLPGKGFSEVYVQHEDGGAGLYRFVTDAHSYFTYTTNAMDITKMDRLMQDKGLSASEAIHECALDRYKAVWGEEFAEEFNN